MFVDIVNILAIVLFTICWFFIIKKLIINKISPVKEVNAEVIDKYISFISSKYPSTLTKERYIVVFELKDKKLSFNVSYYSYNNYKINSKGTLKYKGNKIIDFILA